MIDWHKYKPLWEEAGGHFILHTDAQSSIIQLNEYLNDIAALETSWPSHCGEPWPGLAELHRRSRNET